jgi:hypothetical protein
VHHSRIEPAAEIHSAWCECRDCRQQHDPIAFAAATRAWRTRALLFVGLPLLALWATIIGSAPQIAAAFGVSF